MDNTGENHRTLEHLECIHGVTNTAPEIAEIVRAGVMALTWGDLAELRRKRDCASHTNG